MACTGFSYVIIEPFHPETETANFFLVTKDELPLSVLTEITDSILKQTEIDRCDHLEHRDFQLFGEKLIGKIPDFAALKTFRVYINTLIK